jgi:hypothetical protein
MPFVRVPSLDRRVDLRHVLVARSGAERGPHTGDVLEEDARERRQHKEHDGDLSDREASPSAQTTHWPGFL